MDIHQTISYPLLLISALEITLGIILLRNNARKSRVQKAVAAIAFFSAAFSFTSAAMYMRAYLGLPIDLTARLNWIGWFTVPAALQVLFYLKDDRGRSGDLVGMMLYPIWLVILGLCLFTDLIVMPGYSVIPFINHPGPLENPARLFGSLLAGWLLVDTVRLKRTMRGIKKVKLNYFFYGVLIFGGGAAFTAGVMQLFGGLGFEPGLAAFFSLPWVVLTYYAITRHRLFDIRLVSSRVLSILLLIGLFSAIQIQLFKFFRPALGDSFSILISLTIVSVIFSAARINKRLHGLVEQLVVQDKYDYQAVLKESINAIVTILALEELLDYIIGAMKRSLGVEKACLILRDKKGKFSRCYGQDALRNGEQTILDVLDARLVKTGQGIVREEIEELTSGEARQVREVMRHLNAELVLPLLYKGEIMGLMVLGEKGNRDPYFQSDIDLLESLAGHAAVAIENARLYEEARQAKGSMRESEAKFQTLAETAAMGIFIHQGGNFLYANRASEVIGGYSLAEYLTMDFMSLVHPDFVEIVKSRARDRLGGASGVPSQYEFKIVRKSGEARWVLMTAGISEFDGKPSVIGTLIDITERKQAEEERHQMSLLIENSSDFIGMSTMDGKVLFVNRAGRRLVGLAEADDVRIMSLMDFFLPEDIPALTSQLLPTDAWRGEFRLRHFRSGQPIAVELYGFTVFDEKTRAPMARAAVMRDITDLKRAREERERYYNQLQETTLSLRESEEKFRALAETTTAAIFIHQGQKLVYANPAGEVMSGYTREELMREDFWALIHPDYQELTQEHGQTRARGGQRPQEYEFKFMTKKGEERWAATTAGIIEYGGKPAIIATFFDITEWKQAEEAKVQFYEESVRQYQERIEEEKRHRLEKEKILMDLHDGIGGITTNISILSELALKSQEPAHGARLIKTIARLSREGIAEIRGFMHSLDSKELSWRTLAAELRSQGSNLIKTHDIEFAIETEINDIREQPGSLTWLNVFKIYKEALTNVIKHSRATSVQVVFQVGVSGVLLSIRDNGVGVQGNGKPGRGLSHMKTRAMDIGGEVTISTNQGMQVLFELPLPLKYPASGMAN